MGPSIRDILSIKHTNSTCQVTGINNILSSVSNYKMRHARGKLCNTVCTWLCRISLIVIPVT